MKFILSTIFEMKLLVLIWKVRYYPTFLTNADIRRGIAVFYAKFCNYLKLFLKFNPYTTIMFYN